MPEMDRRDSSASAPVPHHASRGPLPPAGAVALLAVGLAAAALRGPAAGAQPPSAAPAPNAAAAPQAAAGTTAEPQGRVLNVTLVPPAAAPRAAAGRRPGPEAPMARPARAGQQPAPPPPPSAGQPTPQPAAGGRRATARRGPAGSAGLLLLAAVAALLAGRLAWRRRPPRCGKCGASTRRLDAGAAFAELDMGERTEHLVGDVRYAVWRCDACGQVEKRGAARDAGGLIANATAPPVGSAAFLRRRGQSGLSIWSPPAGGGAASHRKPSIAFPRAPLPRVPADDPPPAAAPGDADRR